ncbi:MULTISPECIES: hypothetical protein [Bacillus cereus group]|uniref:Uncharacterized protein n=1 Tax=Bacillus cereus TaxID=1396 RepID=A0AA44Q6Y0_BACCE|nr:MULTISPECIES: hypothetical protein [Bacillus cereus group]PFA22959.1 hypothetical protein CN373_07750 [Bacillus cereus]PFN08959.1 hypothetical protein COJ55_04800 [Bacillus cereus]PFO80574.1 hypothetical protein COJ77_17560 [Bacillus cereus]PFR24255.1 hypothetical protein COK19_18295 [Bacillus cereus]PFR92276.1 hypothetical protein COK38_22505 [Bacillus cereus]
MRWQSNGWLNLGGDQWIKYDPSYIRYTGANYLYSSKHLKQMHKQSRSKDESEAIWMYMQNHEIDDYEYKKYDTRKMERRDESFQM